MLAVFSAATWAVVSAARSSVCVIKTATCAVDSAARSPASIALTWADRETGNLVGVQGRDLGARQGVDLGRGQGWQSDRL